VLRPYLAFPNAIIEDLEPVLAAFPKRSVLRRNEHAVASWVIVEVNWNEDQRTTIAQNLSALLDKAMSAQKPGVVGTLYAGGLVFFAMLITYLAKKYSVINPASAVESGSG
jgi:hypothetical protein